MSFKAPPHDPFDDATATLVRSSELARPLSAVIRTTHEDGTPAQFVLREGKCVIGSGTGAQLVLRQSTVSRAHAELELVAEGVRVTDLGSRNGIFYLGQRIEKMVLGLGARISLGAAVVTIDADATAFADRVFERDVYRGIVGESPAMRRIFAMLERLEGSLVTILIEGESGVGKELIARALHEGSSVAAGPLCVVNCGAIPKELIASELFGHRKGAFTGAIETRKGAFESADGGTLFLDEVGELPLDVQPMLLRALEAGEVRPVGEDRTRHVRVRVVAATNRDLKQEARAGGFREDLFYRLAVVRIRIPNLRERPDDIAPLASHFAKSIGLSELPPAVIEQLKARDWPGNGRELRNAIQAYAALGVLPDDGIPKSAVIDHALGLHVDLSRPYAEQKDAISERFSRLYLTALLEHTGGNQTLAARMAGLDRGYLRRLLAKYGVGTARR